MAGIFGYLNYLIPRSRHYILETLVKGLQRLEYRGYDSAGVAFDGDCNINVKGEKVNKTRYVYTYKTLNLVYIILSFQVICLIGGGKHLVKRHSMLVHV